MKKTIIFILTAAMLMLSACTGKTDTTDPSVQNETVTDNTAEDNSLAEQPQASDDTETETATTQQTEKSKSADGIDVDLTTLSSTAVYAEVWNMMAEPESYIGKTVKMKGIFAVYEDETTGQKYFACIIADALGCCQQGLEFILKGEHKYPDDYPTVDSEITVTGTFETYTEDKFTYCRIKDAVMN